MDFSLTDEQTMLADSVSRFISNDYDFDTRMKIAESDDNFSADLWRTYAELGWTAVPFAEEDGGLGGGTIEIMLMMEQFGRGLVIEPFLANIILAGGVLRRAGTAEQKSAWMAEIIAGNLQATLAFGEPQARFNIADITTTAVADGDQFTINGQKSMVLNGGSAELIIIPARTSGGQRDKDGITLFAVPASSEGLTRKSYKTVDAHAAAEITLNDVRVPASAMLGNLGAGHEILEAVVGDATLAVCAEAIGIMRTMHDKTVEYAKSRVQFGVPIGSFQALQHRMVDTLIACEQSQSLLLWTALLDSEGSSETQKAISALKYQIGTAGKLVGQEAVQIHGGMGVTWELDIAHYFKRLSAIEILFGNTDFHLDRFVALSAQ
jgi:alkylation response protein AidB-like acyl-CoA dehydrogenase